MKKVIILASGVLFLFSCQKNEQPTNLKESGENRQLTASNFNLYVTKDAVKYNRNMVMLSNGKYDCSKSGDNCNVTKRPEDKKLLELAVLDSYIASNNTNGYFTNQNWSLIFPDITNTGLSALINNEIFLYKKDAPEGSRIYVLSTSSSIDNTNDENTIAIWQFAE